VIGSGIAGLLSALHLCKHGKVIIATKKDRADSNTNYAQGGIACVTSSEDSIDEHVKDTIKAGDGLCDEKVVKEIVENGPEGIRQIENFGVKFTEREAPEGTGYDLGKEGGHSKRRVLHVGDVTGRRLEEVLLSRIISEKNIEILEHCMAIDLITTGWLGLDGDNRCVGVYLLDGATGEVFAVTSPCVVLATGGGGKVYLYTSNPDIATGDGVAMAWRAGVPIKNMEFIQFHPTCLYHQQAKSFLISEAVRGEGGKLLTVSMRRFMDDYDERGELASRDVVARAIDNEMKISGDRFVYLDIRHKPADFIKRRFPSIYSTCLNFGLDITKDLIPVVPAAHYFCGGVEAGIDGSTAMKGLFACGEVACTGLHGANRLASNSLLEAVVCARRMAERIISDADLKDSFKKVKVPDWNLGNARRSDEGIVVEHNWNELRSCMWDYVGIVRTDRRLDRAVGRIANEKSEIYQYYHDYIIDSDILELRNIADIAELITRSAMARKESRGLHYTLDYPEADGSRPPVDTVLKKSVVLDRTTDEH